MLSFSKASIRMSIDALISSGCQHANDTQMKIITDLSWSRWWLIAVIWTFSSITTPNIECCTDATFSPMILTLIPKSKLNWSFLRYKICKPSLPGTNYDVCEPNWDPPPPNLKLSSSSPSVALSALVKTLLLLKCHISSIQWSIPQYQILVITPMQIFKNKWLIHIIQNICSFTKIK